MLRSIGKADQTVCIYKDAHRSIFKSITTQYLIRAQIKVRNLFNGRFVSSDLENFFLLLTNLNAIRRGSSACSGAWSQTVTCKFSIAARVTGVGMQLWDITSINDEQSPQVFLLSGHQQTASRSGRLPITSTSACLMDNRWKHRRARRLSCGITTLFSPKNNYALDDACAA